MLIGYAFSVLATGLLPETLAAGAAWRPLISGGVAFLCALALTPLIIRWAHHRNWLAHPRKDRWHKRPTALMGGLAICAAVVTALAVCGAMVRMPWPIYAGGALLFFTGLADDIRGVAPGVKLLTQVVAAMLVLSAGYAFWGGGSIWLSIPLTFLWIVGITNALNLIDGMDGVAAGIATIAALVLAAVAWIGGDVPLTCAAMALAGAAAGFLIFNFPPARIFMGDSGSMLLGFALAVLALAVQAESGAARKPAVLLVPVLVLAVPIFDVVLVTTARVLHGRPITQGGNDHTMHRLAFLGLSDRRTALVLYGVSGLLGGLSLAFYLADRRFFYAMVLFATVALAVFGNHIGEAEVYAGSEEKTGQPRTATQKLGAILQLVVGRYWKTPVGIVGDLLLITGAFLLAHALRFENGLGPEHAARLAQALPGVIGIKIVVFYVAGFYRGIWRYAGTLELVRLLGASLLASLLVFLGCGLVYGFGELSQAVFILDWIIATNAVAGVRFGFRGLRQYLAAQGRMGRRVLLYGAEQSSVLLLRHLRHGGRQDLTPVGFIDDDSRKRSFFLQGLPVGDGRCARCLRGTSGRRDRLCAVPRGGLA